MEVKKAVKKVRKLNLRLLVKKVRWGEWCVVGGVAGEDVEDEIEHSTD